MNSLYTSGTRQTNSILADLEHFRNGDSSVFLQGQIGASLAAMERTIDDYASMAKREMIKAKQEKAQLRIQKLRSDYAEMRTQFEQLKTQAAAKRDEDARAELIAHGGAPSDTRRRFINTPASTSTLPQELISESPFRNPALNMNREQHALHEHSFIQETESRLDDFLAQGTAVLNDLVDQRNMLKGTQRRLLDAANTIGLSRNVINWIERRSTQDTYIFLAGAVFTFFCFWLIYHYLG
ncbi:V-snare-domain-containing protein [Cylindrobasidium torrendii FP15055 ss-10]|uniref:Protein transport protein BOS1 n=1 Tax=Cylindrobasidium torrendii FP15055 ss-10 TaxID=1314674 RepID=A0A0D7B9Q7_9AGAR|nr:V-snare-domain-containing protein [Cylindrobasidium torrendii FP15055 ss-10]